MKGGSGQLQETSSSSPDFRKTCQTDAKYTCLVCTCQNLCWTTDGKWCPAGEDFSFAPCMEAFAFERYTWGHRNTSLKADLVEFRAIFVFRDVQIMIKCSGGELWETSYSAVNPFSACHAEACLPGLSAALYRPA